MEFLKYLLNIALSATLLPSINFSILEDAQGFNKKAANDQWLSSDQENFRLCLYKQVSHLFQNSKS